MIGRFETFTLSLSRLTSYWNKIAAEEMASYGLKGAYIVYLIALYKTENGLTAANLCEMCVKDKAEVSRAMKAMEEKGLVKREQTTSKSYRARITLTDEGRKMTYDLRERIKLAVEKGGAGLTEEERDVFYRGLETISANLKEITKVGL